MFHVHICCLHLSLLSIHSYACTIALSLLCGIATGQKICSAEGIVLSLVQTKSTRHVMMSWWRMNVQYLFLDVFFVVHNPHLLKPLFVVELSVSNYPESNCYQTKSQKCYYPMIQSWQLHQSWVVTVIAAKSHFMKFIRRIEICLTCY